jgi:hypothetical protein
MSGKTFLILALVLVPVAIMVVIVAVETAAISADNIHIVIAFALGATFTVLLSVGLFALSFYSSRSGHDEKIGNEQDSDGA